VVAALDPLGELDLLGGGEERDAPDVLEEELERVGRDLGVRFGLALGLVVGVDDRDLGFVEGGIELVELRRLELELVERERDLVGVETAGLEPTLEQPLRLVRREDVLDRRSSDRALRFIYGQTAPLPRRPSHRSHGTRRAGVRPSVGGRRSRGHPLTTTGLSRLFP